MQELERTAMLQEKPGVWAQISGGGKSPVLPGNDQTARTITHWIEKDIKTDMVVVVRQVQRNMAEFSFDRVINIDFHLERLTLEKHGAFRFDGSSTAGPRGALTLLAPKADVAEAALTGQAWINGRPAYCRPLPPDELALAERLVEPGSEVPAVA
jgi:hypothetical protein